MVLPTSTTHRWVPTGGAAAAVRRSRPRPHRSAAPLPVAPGPVPGARPVLRARPARPRRSRSWWRARTSRCWCGTAASRWRGSRATPTPPPLRRGRAGTAASTPTRFDVRDFEPITGRVHQPPPVHQTFEGPNFVVCSFVPRLFDYHPLGDPGAVQPRERRHRRGPLLLRRRLHEPQGRGHRAWARSPCTRPGSRTGRSRAASRPPSAAGDRGAGRHGRHVPAAGAAAAARRCEDPGYPWTWGGRPPR